MVLTMQETYWAQAWSALVRLSSRRLPQNQTVFVLGCLQTYGARRLEGQDLLRRVCVGIHVHSWLLPILPWEIRYQRFVILKL